MTNGGQWRQWPCLVINLLRMVSGKGRRVWSHRIRIVFVYSGWNNILVTSSTVIHLPLNTPLPSGTMEPSCGYSSHPPCSFSSTLLLFQLILLHAMSGLAHRTLPLPLGLSIPPLFLHSFHTLSSYRQIPRQCVEKTAFPAFSRRWLSKTYFGTLELTAYFCQWKPDVKL